MFDLAEYFRRDQFAAGDGAHATGIGSFVGVEDAFIIAGGAEDVVFSIGQTGEDADFWTGQAFFDDEASWAESVVDEDVFEEVIDHGWGGTDGDAFAGGETIEFEDDGPLGGDVRDGGSGFVEGGGGSVARSGDAVADEEFFGKLFTGFELC